MPVVRAKFGPAQFTAFAKKKFAHAMFHKGKHFVGAALLLQQKSGYYDVVLHLVGQGLECMQKGLLLAKDYDHYLPQLQKKFGHDLVRGSDALYSAYQLKPLRREVRGELVALNGFYREHLLRYGGPHDYFGAALRDLKINLLLFRVAALMRYGDRLFR